ncbi:unnamed protein product, partial [Scytosiphon promiscuus]
CRRVGCRSTLNPARSSLFLPRPSGEACLCLGVRSMFCTPFDMSMSVVFRFQVFFVCVMRTRPLLPCLSALRIEARRIIISFRRTHGKRKTVGAVSSIIGVLEASSLASAHQGSLVALCRRVRGEGNYILQSLGSSAEEGKTGRETDDGGEGGKREGGGERAAIRASHNETCTKKS